MSSSRTEDFYTAMDLRAAGSQMYDRSAEMEPTPLNGFLAEHLAAVRMDLWSSMEQMMTLIKQRAEVLQKDTSRELEASLADLRMENRMLRDRLGGAQVDAIESRTGGTGDTMPPQTPQQPVGEPVSTVRKHQTVSPRSPSHFREHSPPELIGRVSEHEPPPLLDYAPREPVSRISGHDRQVRGGPSPPRGRSLVSPIASPGAPEATRARILPDFRKKISQPGGPGPARNSEGLAARDSDKLSALNSKELAGGPSPTSRSVWGKARSRSKIFGTSSKGKVDGETEAIPFERGTTFDKVAQVRTGVHGAVFADATAMKEKVRAAVTRPEYNVADYYWDTGIAQSIARHQLFEYGTLSVIAVNAIWIAVDVDGNDKELLLDADPIYQVAEHLFCTFFTFEWTVRFMSFREKRFGLRDAWFCFDSVLVAIMILETWIMTLLFLAVGLSSSGNVGNTSVLKLIRLVRLTRMARMAKLLRAMPELIILIKGIWVAARSVFFTLVLLMIIIYVFAIIFRQVTDGTEIGEQYYASVWEAMASLLLDGVLPDQAPYVRNNGDAHILLGFLQLLFILLSSLTVMNLLVGVLCEVVSVVSSVEKEQLTVSYVKQKLLHMFIDTTVDSDGSKTISRVEFESMLTNHEAAEIIQDLGVDVVGLVDFADIIFEDDIELSFGDFMELVLQLRGSNNCTVKDMVDLRKFVVTELSTMQSKTISVLCYIMGIDPNTIFETGSVPFEMAASEHEVRSSIVTEGPPQAGHLQLLPPPRLGRRQVSFKPAHPVVQTTSSELPGTVSP